MGQALKYIKSRSLRPPQFYNFASPLNPRSLACYDLKWRAHHVSPFKPQVVFCTLFNATLLFLFHRPSIFFNVMSKFSCPYLSKIAKNACKFQFFWEGNKNWFTWILRLLSGLLHPFQRNTSFFISPPFHLFQRNVKIFLSIHVINCSKRHFWPWPT